MVLCDGGKRNPPCWREDSRGLMPFKLLTLFDEHLLVFPDLSPLHQGNVVDTFGKGGSIDGGRALAPLDLFAVENLAEGIGQEQVAVGISIFQIYVEPVPVEGGKAVAPANGGNLVEVSPLLVVAVELVVILMIIVII